MLNFLRDNWIWIATPIVIFVIALVVLILMSGDEATPFMYNPF
jgi:hypothetical protein